MKSYSTVMGLGVAEQIIEKSRFIAYVSPAESREEADAFIEVIRKKHRDATHNVPAMVIGDGFQIQWASDDGEPQGTSGAPIVQMMVQEGITNTVVVVTRYFGGIKLGTGGLVRAYTSSAKNGLVSAKICDVEAMEVIPCKIDYKAFNKVQNYNFEGKAEIQDIDYAECVNFTMVSQPENTLWCKNAIMGISNGEAVFGSGESRLVKIPK